MMIEPLFSNPIAPKENKNRNPIVDHVINEVDSCKNIDLNFDFIKNDPIENVVTVDANVNIVGSDLSEAIADSAQDKTAVSNDVYDVTILPEKISSFSHCLYFMSARRNRLSQLRDAAVWRAIQLSLGWFLITLFVFWLSSNFSPASTFPTNPLRYFFREKKKKEKKEKKYPLGHVLKICMNFRNGINSTLDARKREYFIKEKRSLMKSCHHFLNKKKILRRN